MPLKTDRELKKLKRAELLEIMLEQSRRIEELEARLEQANAELESRRILFSRCGSLADAAMQLNGVFEAAQSAANQYLENIVSIYEEVKAKAGKSEVIEE